MRTGKLALLAITSAGLFACSSSTSQGALTFTVAESLFVFQPDDATSGYVLLSNAIGNCAALQKGIQPVEIGNTSYLLILLGQLNAQGQFAPLTAGTYNILDPNSSTSPTPPALIGTSALVQTDSACGAAGANATSGTATLAPLDTSDGGSSTLNYSAVYDGVQISGTNQLTTCLVDVLAPALDGGCATCTGPGDGGPCTIQ